MKDRNSQDFWRDIEEDQVKAEIRVTSGLAIRETVNHFLPPSSKKNFMERAFSKMESGSLRGSVFSMAASAIGSGVLTLPFVCAQSGLLIGLVLIVMGAVGCGWSLYMLVQRARHHNLFNYSQIAHKTGGKFLERTLQISILMYMFATCLAC